MLKADLHIHTKEDPHDSIKHSAKQLIDHAAKLNFDVISITNHDSLTYSKKLSEYAKSKGILLIPGIEKRIKGKEVLLYNFTKKEIKKIKTFEDLKKLKNGNKLVIAPHPYFGKPQCLKDLLIKHIDVFDAIEYSYFHTKHINLNKKAISVKKKYNKPLIGTSDLHRLWQMDYTYSLIDSKERKKEKIFGAIRENKVKLKTKPLPYHRFISAGLDAVFSLFRKY